MQSRRRAETGKAPGPRRFRKDSWRPLGVHCDLAVKSYSAEIRENFMSFFAYFESKREKA